MTSSISYRLSNLVWIEGMQIKMKMKEFLQKLLAIWACAPKMFASPVLGQKLFIEYWFRRAPNY